MLGNWKEKLSILICEYFLDGFEGTRRFESDGFSEKIYLFRADYTLGLTTEWKHIFMNQRLFEEDLKKTQRQIFLHEQGHAKSSTLHIFLGGLSQLYLYTAGLLIVFLALYTLVVEGFLNITLLGLTSAEAWFYLSILTLLFPLAIATSYIIETKADLFSLKYMEPEDFREAKESYKDIQPITRTRLFLIRLTHPSADFVLRIKKILDKIRS